jgi:hypothetical protein
LYGSGLHVNEALGLTMRDVDLEQRIVTVRHTKFNKTRLVPIGPKLALDVSRLGDCRRQIPMPDGEDSRFFASRTGAHWDYPRVIALFQRVRRAAGIGCPAGELRPPRMHDIRHTAAVHKVIAWYRSGQDVQRLLPQPATYLGNVEISSTQRYLQATPHWIYSSVGCLNTTRFIRVFWPHMPRTIHSLLRPTRSSPHGGAHFLRKKKLKRIDEHRCMDLGLVEGSPSLGRAIPRVV